MSYYNLIKLAEMPKSKKEALRERFNDRVLYPSAAVMGLGGLGAVAGYSSGKSAISKAVDKAEEEANAIINRSGGLNEQRANLEDIVAKNQKRVNDSTDRFKNKIKDLGDQAEDIINNKKKLMSIEEISEIMNRMNIEDKNKVKKVTDEFNDLLDSKKNLLMHEEKIRDFREGKIQDARKLLKNTVGLRTLAGGVGAGTLGYGAYNMYRNMRNKD